MTTIITDIDGVYVPFFARSNPELGFREYEGYGERAFLKPEMQKPWLETFMSKATLVWGSKWKEPNKLLALLGINANWEKIEISNQDVGLGTWKIKSIRKWVEENLSPEEKLVWIDDELEEDAFEWARVRGNMLSVAPDRVIGLTQEQFEEIDHFISA